eukprot:s3680_g4.t1
MPLRRTRFQEFFFVLEHDLWLHRVCPMGNSQFFFDISFEHWALQWEGRIVSKAVRREQGRELRCPEEIGRDHDFCAPALQCSALGRRCF